MFAVAARMEAVLTTFAHRIDSLTRSTASATSASVSPGIPNGTIERLTYSASAIRRCSTFARGVSSFFVVAFCTFVHVSK